MGFDVSLVEMLRQVAPHTGVSWFGYCVVLVAGDSALVIGIPILQILIIYYYFISAVHRDTLPLLIMDSNLK